MTEEVSAADPGQGLDPTWRRVGLLGGTFDPVHAGHLAVARAAQAHEGLDAVLFVPARVSPFKAGEPPPAAGEHRWLMTVLATLDEPTWRVVRWDLDAPGPSYAVRTAQAARDVLGDAVDVVWLIGADNLAGLPHWREVGTLAQLVRFAVVPRLPLSGGRLDEAVGDAIAAEPALQGRLHALPMEPVPVSATATRAAVAAGSVPPGALPATVATYVARYGLYRDSRPLAGAEPGPVARPVAEDPGPDAREAPGIGIIVSHGDA